mmetsp:Transcript_5129/g.10757  ORF Transcript_5129/g.10757 Transcript_5129/m.10757 type:complete len:490 (+) Transcript_5129:183-1652(+)
MHCKNTSGLSKMQQHLPGCTRRRLAIESSSSLCRDPCYSGTDSFGADRRRFHSAGDEDDDCDRNNSVPDQEPREAIYAPWNPLQTGFGKRRPSKSLMPMIVVILVVMAIETRYAHVQAFSSHARTAGKRTRKHCGRISRQRLPKLEGSHRCSKSCLDQRGCRSSSSNVPDSSSAFLAGSTATVPEQDETIIPLEWIEFFDPKYGDGDDGETTTEPPTPVLFLHGLLGSKRNFATCAKMLAVQLEKKRKIMGVDLRNHGETQPWSDEMSYPSMAKDVVDFLESQNMKKAILVGHSMGGKVAQALALLYPEYVEGLVVLDIAPVTYTREEDPHWRAVEDILRAVHAVIEESEAEGKTTKSDIDLSLRKSIPDPALRAFVLTNFDGRNNKWKIPIATMVEELEQIAGFDLTATSATVAAAAATTTTTSSATYEGDVFIINGGQSRFVRHAYMDTIASYFPNHMLTTIRGSGHWVHAEAPDDLVALLKRYLDR